MIKKFNDYILENYLEYFFVNGNKYWFEVRDPRNEKGYSVGWGVGDIKDDNFSKFDRTDRHEQFLIFSEVKKLFKKWFDENKPDNFYFSVPGEKRLNIYLNYLQEIIGDGYTHEVLETEYPPFDRREKKVYYAVFKKVKSFNENSKHPISFEEAKEWIKQNYSSERVSQMFDEEVSSGNWIDKDQMEEEGYDSEYDYYIDYGHGEAEDAVMTEIVDTLKSEFEIEFDEIGSKTNIYDFLKDEYDCL